MNQEQQRWNNDDLQYNDNDNITSLICSNQTFPPSASTNPVGTPVNNPLSLHQTKLIISTARMAPPNLSNLPKVIADSDNFIIDFEKDVSDQFLAKSSLIKIVNSSSGGTGLQKISEIERDPESNFIASNFAVTSRQTDSIIAPQGIKY